MECDITWQPDGMCFTARTGSGHHVTMAGPPENGGLSSAPRPMEMVLLGTGGCTAYDVVLILKKGRHDIRGCTVHITAQRAPQPPQVFTHIEFHFTVTGRGLNRAAVERAVQLSHEKYCSASIMLAKTATLTHTVTLIDADAEIGGEAER